MDWLTYQNQGAIRNKPISPKLAQAFGFLPELGISMDVFSGGQPEKGSGGKRTGSVRHDLGNSADVFFSKNGKRLDWSNPDDVPIYQDIVRRAKANGVTGFGAGENYMQPGSMHVGFGKPAVWGAGGRGANAPEWLSEAYSGKQAGSQTIANDTMRVLGKQPKGLLTPKATNNTESKMIPEEKPRGLLGSLGIQKMEEGAEGEAGQRFFQRDTFKDTAAQLAQGFAAMGSNPALQKMTADVASQRTESKAKNKTIEYLRANGRGDLADAVDSGSLGIRDAAGIMFAQPKDGSTAAKKNYDAYQKILAEEGPEAAKQFLSMSRSGSTTNVNMPKQMGTITPGWKADYDNDGNVTSMSVIPGGPAAQEIEAQRVKAETQDNTGSIMGRNVVQTASRVRDLISPYSVGYGSLLSALPESAARELKGEVDVLGAIASSENLNAMRLASPTGGALGNVSDSDIKLLKDKSGAIDIGSSPSTFRRQVDEYELFLLQVIHGPEAGQYMFDNSRPAPVSPAVTDGEPKSKETIRDDAMRKWLKDNKRGAD